MSNEQKLREALLSDMDIAVLRMPVHLAFAGNMAQFQYHNRVQALLDRIEALATPTADHIPDAGEKVADHLPNAGKMIEPPQQHHHRDSKELRSLCQARDEARKQRDLCQAEIAGLNSAVGYLSAMVDEQTRLVQKAVKAMKALHETAKPDDGPDMNAIIPAAAFHVFVDVHAELMFSLKQGPQITTQSKPRPSTSTTAAPVGERDRFEQFAQNCPMGKYNVARRGEGYDSSHTQIMWDAWQARAALNAGDAVDAQRWKTSELISRAALTHPDKRTEQMNIAFNAYRKAMESGQSYAACVDAAIDAAMRKGQL